MLVITDGGLGDAVVVQEYLGLARVLAGYEVNRFQGIERAQGDVAEVADRCADQIKSRFSGIASFGISRVRRCRIKFCRPCHGGSLAFPFGRIQPANARAPVVLQFAPDEMPEGAGDVWTWVGIDADTKLIISYLVGGRDGEWACQFMQDLAARVSNRIQLTTDGHRVY